MAVAHINYRGPHVDDIGVGLGLHWHWGLRRIAVAAEEAWDELIQE